jgi:hypothetical protein
LSWGKRGKQELKGLEMAGPVREDPDFSYVFSLMQGEMKMSRTPFINKGLSTYGGTTHETVCVALNSD